MNKTAVVIGCVLLTLPTLILVYHALPGIFFMLRKDFYREAGGLRLAKDFSSFAEKMPFPKSWKKRLNQRITEAGIGDQNAWVYWTALTFLMPAAIFGLLAFQRLSFGNSLVLCALCFVSPNLYLRQKIQKRKQAFIMSAYQIYSFLHSQISSGIKATDAIRGLYEIADHPLIQKTFIRLAAQYELTLNIEESLQVLKNSFSGYDCDMLCASILQCVNTGMAGKTLLKMEQIMFSKYFFYLQKDTEKYKGRLVVSGVFAMAPTVMVFLFPMIADSIKAFESILKIT